MRSASILIIALMIAVIVPHVCAENTTSIYIDPLVFSATDVAKHNNVIYPLEYYVFQNQSYDSWIQYGKSNFDSYWSTIAIYSKLSAIQIALEKQNELINEQNKLLKKLINQTYTTECMYGMCDVYKIKPNKPIGEYK